MRRMIAALAIACLPNLAMAEGFTTEDLGSIADDPACLERARLVFDEFGKSSRAGEVVSGAWTISAFDLGTDDYDALLACAFGPKEMTRATLIVYHSDKGDEETGRDIAARLKKMWEAWE